MCPGCSVIMDPRATGPRRGTAGVPVDPRNHRTTRLGPDQSSANPPMPASGGTARPPLEELVDPPVWVRPVAVLDADEFLAQPQCHRARSAVTDDPLGVGPFDLAHRIDHRGGPAGEHLGQFPGLALSTPLIGRDL